MSHFKKSRPDQVETIKTAVFQIHNPSRRKRAMLHDCMYRHHLACTKAISLLTDQLEMLMRIEDKKFDREIEGLVRPVITAMPLSAAAKDGAVNHLVASLRSYRELKIAYDNKIKDKSPDEINKMGGIPGVPTVNNLTNSQLDWNERLEAFHIAIDLDEETKARDALLKESKAGMLRPVIFPRYAFDKGFTLLRHPEKEQYFVFLNLHPKNSRFASSVNLDGLIDVRTGDVCSLKTKIGAIFPINFGKDFHLDGFIHKAIPKTAKLVKKVKDGEDVYFVHLSFTYVAEKMTTRSMLGVDRGIRNLASIAVIDDKGAVLARENISGKALSFVQRIEERRQKLTQKKGGRYRSNTRKAEADRAVHVAANKIVDMAKKYQSQVVIENLRTLSDRSSKRGRSNFNGMLNRTQYEKLLSVLDYKLNIEGLPKAKKIHAANTSRTCPKCGSIDKANRIQNDIYNRFKCVSCDFEDDADLNAAFIIAAKKQWRDQLPPSQKKKDKDLMGGAYCFKSFLTSLATQKKTR